MRRGRRPARLPTAGTSPQSRGRGSGWATYRNSRFNLALTYPADVFAYVADFADVCTAVARVLAPGGLFGFTVETHDGEGAIVGPKMRYAHSADFVRDAIEQAGLTLIELTHVSSRTENRVPVSGLLVLACR